MKLGVMLSLLTFDNGKRLDVNEASTSVDVPFFVFEGRGARKWDVLVATKDFPENGCHCDDLRVLECVCL